VQKGRQLRKDLFTHLRKRLGAFGFFLYLVGFLPALAAEDGFSWWGTGADAALSFDKLLSKSCSSSFSCNAAANRGPAEGE
jgi:hypothetical protein